MLTSPHCPPDVTLTLPPSSALTTASASIPPPINRIMLPKDHQDMPPTLPPHASLQSLHSRRNLKICLQHCHPMSSLTHPYASAASLLTILRLPWRPQPPAYPFTLLTIRMLT
ncbi:hypothetical protein O181_086751 [Austropuccinia psidii MF-1]|uniref:Uncharacterized protein n=1 Tax=Austropuccinia psidii MF-1 TaxID=1389203 RepID=A0A9Q3FVH5_9BASI|nr:hypothetical protein [Austropuccinia psidii MF-1]